MQGSRSRREGDRVFRTYIFRNRRLKALNGGPGGEPITPKYFNNGRDITVVDVLAAVRNHVLINRRRSSGVSHWSLVSER